MALAKVATEAKEKDMVSIPATPVTNPVTSPIGTNSVQTNSVVHHSLPAKPLNDSLILPPFLAICSCLPFWEKHAPRCVVQLITHGVGGLCERACLNVRRQVHTLEELMEAEELLNVYIQVGAARKLPPNFRPRYLVPWFGKGGMCSWPNIAHALCASM